MATLRPFGQLCGRIYLSRGRVPGGKGGFRGPPPKNKEELVDLGVNFGVDLGVDLGGRGVRGVYPLRVRKNQWIWEWIWGFVWEWIGRKGGFRGSHPESKKKSVDLGVHLGSYQGNLESVPEDFQAFHYWEVYAPSTC